MPICSAGHDSATSDYCDVCGIALDEQAVDSAGLTDTSSPASRQETESDTPAEQCPDCGTARVGRFCEECGHDFISGTVGSWRPSRRGVWSAVVTADRFYFETVVANGGPDTESICFPLYCPERRFLLSGEQVRIGRRSVSRGIMPEIDLSGPPEDPGVSHLHAVLLSQPDGTWALLDPGSTNGTMLNDGPDPVKTNVPIPLADGDRIHIGAWTTIMLRAYG